MSVLDSRKGEWQERKKIWYNYGLNSSESRDNIKVTGSFSGSVPGYYNYKKQQENKIGRELSHKEFTEKYIQNFLPSDSQIKQTASGGVLSIFDPVLCELMYYWFCPEGGKILDPFSGGSVRGIVASKLGYKYTGIDLRQEQIEANKNQANKLLKSENVPCWICGNSLNIDNLVSEQYDFIFSCPPYFDLEVYSDDPQDLSNMCYEEFKKQYNAIINSAVAKLKQDRFACFVVGDIRDKKTGAYRNFVSETINAFIAAGMQLYNEIILVTPLGSLPIRAGRSFSSARKVGKTHQNVLVFYKGDAKKIKDNFNQIKVAEILEEPLTLP